MKPAINNRKFKLATLAGILAIIMWSSNVAVSKAAMNELGAYSAAFYIYFFSGILNIIILFAAFGKIKLLNHFKALPLSYYLNTGIFILINNVFFFLALGFARTNEELIIVALLNYLWPVLITIFRVPIYHVKIRPLLFIAGISTALAGIIIALLQGYKLQELLDITRALDDNFIAFFFAFIGAVSWAIYSNLIKKYGANDDVVALPLIFIFSGFVFFVIELIGNGAQSLSLYDVYNNPFLIYTIIGPTCLGYLFWFVAMKYGNRTLVTSLSYLIPLGSVFILSQVHHIPVRPMFWVSAVLIITGAVLGMKSVSE
jgi:drug/metabolite transporter (DMT)-like permease